MFGPRQPIPGGSAEPFVGPMPTSENVVAPYYPDLVGMFTHATGRVQDMATGKDVELFAWSHDGLLKGYSRIFRNADTSFWFNYKTGYFEVAAVVGDWVRYMGTGSWIDGDPKRELFARVEMSDGTPGSPFAKVHATEPYTVDVEAYYVAPPEPPYNGMRRRFHDLIIWAPTTRGWVSQEMFRYPDETTSSEWPGFQSVVAIEPGRLFASATQTFVHRDGHSIPGMTCVNREWGRWK